MMTNSFKKANMIISIIFFLLCLLSILLMFIYSIDTSGDKQPYAWFEPIVDMFSVLGGIFGLVILFILSIIITILFIASQLVFLIIELVNKHRLPRKDFIRLTVMNSCFLTISALSLILCFLT